MAFLIELLHVQQIIRSDRKTPPATYLALIFVFGHVSLDVASQPLRFDFCLS